MGFTEWNQQRRARFKQYMADMEAADKQRAAKRVETEAARLAKRAEAVATRRARREAAKAQRVEAKRRAELEGKAAGAGFWARQMATGHFTGLGVNVREGQVYRHSIAGGIPLGPLAGSYAEITDGARSHRVAGAALSAAALGPAGLLVGLSKKSKASCFVVLANGAVHERKLDGNSLVRLGQRDVTAYNAMARKATEDAAK